MVLPELTAYLQAQGVGTQATDLFYGEMPPTPDAMVTLLHYGGGADEPEMGESGIRLEFPHIQGVARGVRDDFDGPMQKLTDVVVALAKIGTRAGYVTLSGVNYKAVQFLQPVMRLKRDENFRHIFVVSFRVTKEFSAT